MENGKKVVVMRSEDNDRVSSTWSANVGVRVERLLQVLRQSGQIGVGQLHCTFDHTKQLLTFKMNSLRAKMTHSNNGTPVALFGCLFRGSSVQST